MTDEELEKSYNPFLNAKSVNADFYVHQKSTNKKISSVILKAITTTIKYMLSICFLAIIYNLLTFFHYEINPVYSLIAYFSVTSFFLSIHFTPLIPDFILKYLEFNTLEKQAEFANAISDFKAIRADIKDFSIKNSKNDIDNHYLLYKQINTINNEIAEIETINTNHLSSKEFDNMQNKIIQHLKKLSDNFNDVQKNV